jgi:hypothetical protein
MANLGKLLGLGIAGFGVYWAGSNFGWWGGSTPAPAGSTATPAVPIASTVTTVAPLTSDQQTALIAALKAAGAVCAAPGDSSAACVDPTYNGSQWNWFMQNKTNPGSTPAQLASDQTMDASAYVAARVAAGFGLGWYRGPTNYVRKVRFA